MSVLGVLFTIEVSGLVVIALIVAAQRRAASRDASDLAVMALAGTAGITALGTFYRALAIGTMSIVAPISATGRPAGDRRRARRGDPFTALLGLGLGATLAGVVLASREDGRGRGRARASRAEHPRWRSAPRSASAPSSCSSTARRTRRVLWALLMIRVVAVPLVGGLVLARRERAAARPRPRRAVLAPACWTSRATGLYRAGATARAPLSVVSVVGSLYPVVTVLLRAGRAARADPAEPGRRHRAGARAASRPSRWRARELRGRSGA